MCRITGVYNFSGAKSIGDLKELGTRMRDTMVHGGPDDQGDYINETGQVFLGHRRLSIIDLSADGHQPMYFNEWVVVFNGEIYNYQEVKTELQHLGYEFHSGSDTEVLLKAFDKWGYDTVNRFRGMFAFALWNRQTEKLLLCRDRVGVKPLYWYSKDGLFLFGSELKSLRQFKGLDTTIDQAAVSLFLQVGYIKSPYSIFEYVRKVEPGGMLEIDSKGNIKQWKYWSVNKNINPLSSGRSDAEVLDTAESILTESARYRMVSDVPVGVFLSGGIDSSLVTALLQKKSPTPIKTFTIGFEDKNFNEADHARKVAEHLHTDHYEMICTVNDFREILPLLPDMYDEPFGDSSAIPTHLVSRLARKHVTVALSADGGDEVFTGYTRYKAARDYYNKMKFLPAGLRRQASKILDATDLKTIEKLLRITRRDYNSKALEWQIPKLINTMTATSRSDFFRLSATYIKPKELERLTSSSIHPVFDETRYAFDKDFLFAALGKIDIESYLEGDILTKVDRATMLIALEGREPLLDHKVIEFGLSLQDRYKIRNGQTKWVLRNILYKYVPAELIERPKQGFAVPIKEWLETELSTVLKEMVGDQLFAESLRLNQKVLKEIVDNFLQKRNNVVNPHFIWFLYALYTWYKRWL